MTLNLIGIGYKKKHINFEQLEIIKKSKKIFLEYYTSFYEDSFEDLEKFLGKKIIICNRKFIENEIEEKIIKKSKNEEISLLILGDPLIATTHTDLLLRCRNLKIKTKIFNNISIGNLITQTGLNFYKFGKITSIPFFFENFMPRTPYLYFLENHKIGAHTLFLLDLKPDKNKFLSIKDSLQFLLDIQNIIKENEELKTDEIGLITKKTKVIVLEKLGFKNQKIIYNELNYFLENDNFQPPLCLIIPEKMNEVEKEFLEKLS